VEENNVWGPEDSEGSGDTYYQKRGAESWICTHSLCTHSIKESCTKVADKLQNLPQLKFPEDELKS
jgi:hypothetical protein